ncbi:MAG: glycosyltransferase [Gammaproteobacteria bacterium]|nr:glycosyltransferase [Gammaproteobacteria bacterium]
MNHLLSIVIPLAPAEDQWLTLCANFDLLPANSEIIVVAPAQDKIDGKIAQQITALALQFDALTWQVVYSDVGRAKQLNTGAQAATNHFIWFLHADTVISSHNVATLINSLSKQGSQQALFYFDLFFHDKHHRWLAINEFGAKFRSDIFGLPFGDQGFCIDAQLFSTLGGYDEQALFGEDHLLVWQAKLSKIKLINCPSSLATSARKYQHHGWHKLTLKYQMLWPQQALPQWLKLIKIKLGLD